MDTTPPGSVAAHAACGTTPASSKSRATKIGVGSAGNVREQIFAGLFKDPATPTLEFDVCVVVGRTISQETDGFPGERGCCTMAREEIPE